MNEIDKYMTVAEAADRWGINVETVKTKLKPAAKVSWAKTEKMIDDGLLKFYQKPNGQRREWIISADAMELWFGKKE